MSAVLLLGSIPAAQVSAKRGAVTSPDPDADPDAEDPFLPAPNGQAQTRPSPAPPVIAKRASLSRRYALSLAPVVSGLRLPLSGRSDRRIGFGHHLDFEYGITPWLWLQAGWRRLYYFAYANAQPDPDSNEATPLAAQGWMRWQDLNLGVRYAIDDGVVRPVLEAGVGWSSLHYPSGVAQGQAEQSCGTNNACDPGLSCIEDECRPTSFPSAYIGVEAQWMIARYFSLGVATRYYASMMAARGMEFPAQWSFSLRASLRY